MEKKRAAKQRMPGVAGGGQKNGQATPEPRKTKSRLQILSDASFEAIFLSERGICIDQNLTAEKLFGYTLREALGRHGSEWIIPQDRERVVTMMLLDYTEPYNVTALRKDGTTFACEIQARTMDMGGRTIRVTALRDITERKKSDDAIKESEEKLRQIMENMFDVVWLISFDQSRMLYVSPSYERVWGRSCQSLYDNPRGYMQTIHPRDKPAVITRFRQYALTRRFDHSFRIVRPNGGVRWIHARMFPIRDERGEVVRHAGISADITEEKLAEETLHKAQSELVQANALLAVRADQLRALAGELTMAEQRERKRVSNVLHDGLQQNLASVRLQLAGLMQQQLAALLVRELNEIDQVIAESIAMSRSLIADLSPPVLHDRGLGAGLEWLARRMQEKHGISVELCVENNIELAEDIKHLVFESVRELLFNVVKHAGVDHAQVRMQHSQEAGMRITIRDEGMGFDPKRLRSAGDVGGGFGLFSISERIGLLGGTFEIDSAPGKGSRFVLTVPARR
jgi:PAS domain S-box-containing protein